MLRKVAGIVLVLIFAFSSLIYADTSNQDTAKVIRGFKIPITSSLEVKIPEDDEGYEIVFYITYSDPMDNAVFEKALEDLKGVLAGRLEEEPVVKAIEVLKGKQTIAEGFEGQLVYTKDHAMYVFGNEGDSYAGIAVTGINYDQVEPYVMPAPSFKYYNQPGNTAKVQKSVTLKQLSMAKGTDKYIKPADYAKYEYKVPNPVMDEKGSIPDWVPAYYRGERLVKAMKYEGNVLLVFGKNFGEGRYLLSMDPASKTVRYALDFVNYAYHPGCTDKSFVSQRISWAKEENGILYVCHSHLTYSADSKGMNAYITALRLEDKSVLWRSAPLVANAYNFEIVGDTVVTGYGFTKEKDYLYVLDKLNGKTLCKVLLKDSPETIFYKNSKLYISTYAYSYIFSIISK